MAADRPARRGRKSASLPVQDKVATAAPAGPNPHQNQLLDALPANDFERFAFHLELVPMGLGDVLYESGSVLHRLLPYVAK
jgi:hypothetical protein